MLGDRYIDTFACSQVELQARLAGGLERGLGGPLTPVMLAQQHAQMKQYEDELARKRYASEHEQTRQRNAEMVRMQEEDFYAALGVQRSACGAQRDAQSTPRGND